MMSSDRMPRFPSARGTVARAQRNGREAALPGNPAELDDCSLQRLRGRNARGRPPGSRRKDATVSHHVEPERLEVLAALLDHDPEASYKADAWVTARGLPADACLIESATADEWDLADAIRGDSMAMADAEAIAILLRLAGRSPLAALFAKELRQMFLDGKPEARAAAFGVVYWSVAMVGMCDATQDQAAALLARIGTS